jgi:hypothetical protein
MYFVKYFEKRLIDYFSNEDNRSRIFLYIKTFFSYVVAKKLIKNTIFYGLFMFLLFTSVLQLNIDFKYIVKTGVSYVNNVVGSMDLKTALVGEVNKKAIIEDDTNNVFMSDAFKIEKKNSGENHYFNALRLPASVHNNYNKCSLLTNYNWSPLVMDEDKCKNLLLMFKKESMHCIIQTINNNNTKKWINGCYMIDVMVQEAIKNNKINKDTSILICGIRYSHNDYYVYMYIGESYAKMQEFERNIFLDKIVPIYNIKQFIN